MADEKQTTALNLPVDLVEELDRLAEKETRSRSNMATLLLQDALAKRARPPFKTSAVEVGDEVR